MQRIRVCHLINSLHLLPRRAARLSRQQLICAGVVAAATMLGRPLHDLESLALEALITPAANSGQPIGQFSFKVHVQSDVTQSAFCSEFKRRLT